MIHESIRLQYEPASEPLHSSGVNNLPGCSTHIPATEIFPISRKCQREGLACRKAAHSPFERSATTKRTYLRHPTLPSRVGNLAGLVFEVHGQLVQLRIRLILRVLILRSRRYLSKGNGVRTILPGYSGKGATFQHKSKKRIEFRFARVLCNRLGGLCFPQRAQRGGIERVLYRQPTGLYHRDDEVNQPRAMGVCIPFSS